MDIDTARDGAYRRIGCVIRGSQNALVVRIVCVARIQSLTLGPIEYVFAGEVDTHLADSEFLGELRRQCIAEVDVLQGQVACVDQETVGGISFPFMRHTIQEGKKTRFVAAEPASCPKLTRGKFQYDFGDEAGYTPLLPMFTLGHNFAPAHIHAGGLRYHGAGVIVSQLLKDNLMEAVDIQQLESFEAGCLFAQSEGIIPAPESSHAIAAAIREANKCKETGEEKVILFNLSGHGLIDMTSYDKYLAGDLVNYTLNDEDIQKNLDEIGDLAK